MAFTDHYFPKFIENYLNLTSSDESPLMADLRHTTNTQTSMPRMLSGNIEGQLLQMLVKLKQPKKVLEIGTFTGYSALNLAKNLPDDAKLFTLEAKEQNAKIAQKYFNLAPFGHKIELILGDALESIQNHKSLTNQAWDLIFIDADKQNYPNYYDLLIDKLNPGGLIIVDNALWNGKVAKNLNLNPSSKADKDTLAIHNLNIQAKKDTRVDTAMLTIRDGILLIIKR